MLNRSVNDGLSAGQIHAWRRIRHLAVIFMLLLRGAAHAEDERFDIQRFEVSGNTLLASSAVAAIVTPFAGNGRVFGDIQRALEALENAYITLGYSTVQVYVPEQLLNQGVVHLQVSEGTIGKITVASNRWFGEANILASLPALRLGRAPNMRQIADNLQLANENPAKKIDVTLGIAEEEGKIDAKVSVVADRPEIFSLSVDNTGTSSTGHYRLGLAFQEANLASHDQVVSLAYTMAPDAPSGTRTAVYSLAYRLPIYSLGDSFDLLYGNSSANTPTVQATGFNLAGKGEVVSLHWNHYFSRRGENTSKLVAGFDYKHMNSTCEVNGQPVSYDPNASGLISTCVPYTLRPLSLTYVWQRQSPGKYFDYRVGVLRNTPLGAAYPYTTPVNTTAWDRYSFVSVPSGRPIPDAFSYYKASFNMMAALPGDWSVRAAFAGQYSTTPLPSPEQLGIAGSTAVRGFDERIIAGDKGYFVNLEAYGPELSKLAGIPGSLRAVVFYDFGRVYNDAVQGIPYSFDKAELASLGAGLRYGLSKNASIKLDVARVLDAGPVASGERPGNCRAHLSLQASF